MTKSDFHIASPLPGTVPRSGRISADRCTTAPGVRGDGVGVVGGVGVDDHDLVEQAAVSISASRTRVTTSPTVAASLRAGTTRLTVVAAPWRRAGRRASSRASGGCCASNQLSRAPRSMCPSVSGPRSVPSGRAVGACPGSVRRGRPLPKRTRRWQHDRAAPTRPSPDMGHEPTHGGVSMRRLVIGLAALAALALAAPAQAITNGTADGNAHPNVGGLVAAKAYSDGTWIYCSGTLIAPTVFLTAAHCAEGGDARPGDLRHRLPRRRHGRTPAPSTPTPPTTRRRATRTTSPSSSSTRRSRASPRPAAGGRLAVELLGRTSRSRRSATAPTR